MSNARSLVISINFLKFLSVIYDIKSSIDDIVSMTRLYKVILMLNPF